MTVASSDLAILAEGLQKQYRSHTALHRVDLAVPAGTVLGVLGPNGAGKTTTVRILATLVEPSAGRAVVAGHDVVREGKEVRRRIGLAGQYAAVDELLTGRENMVLLAKLLRYGRRGAALREKGVDTVDFEVCKPTLDDVFFQLTGTGQKKESRR